MRMLWAFLWRDIQNEISYRVSFILQILGIFPVVLVFFYISRLFGGAMLSQLESYGGRYFPFVLLGLAVQSYLVTGLSSFAGSIREAQLSGTLESIFATPVRLPVFLLGSTLYAFFFNSLRIGIFLVLGAMISDGGFHWGRLPSVCLIMGLTMTAFATLGILSASFIVLFKRGDPFNWLFSVGSWLLGGVYYPVSVLPDWLQTLSGWVPMTHTLEALRHVLLSDASLAAVSGHMAKLALWAAIGLPLSCYCFGLAVDRARARGTLGHY
ncbi:MAG: ABC transporter permease [Acidobacteriota bacterium]